LQGEKAKMSSDDKKKINAMMVVEVLGRPPEYLTETLDNIIKAIGEENGVVVVEKRLVEPVAMKEKPDFYSSFAEIEVELEEILNLAILMFKYMPAHVEIVSPQNFNLSNSGFNDLFNELTRRLHGYEEIARILQTEKMILENQLKTILGEKKEELEKTEKKAKEEKIKKPRKPRTKKIKSGKEEKAKEKKTEESEEKND
jgi:hypothetical protein